MRWTLPRLIWAVPGIVAWAVLQIAAVQYCTDWRDEQAKYGFAALVLLLWWAPSMPVGETGASEVEQLVLIAGIYLAVLVVDEALERRKVGKEKLRADS